MAENVDESFDSALFKELSQLSPLKFQLIGVLEESRYYLKKPTSIWYKLDIMKKTVAPTSFSAIP